MKLLCLCAGSCDVKLLCLCAGSCDMKLRSICRKSYTMGPLQRDIPFKKGHHYVFEAYVKLLNDTRGKLWQKFKAMIQMTLPKRSK